MKAVDVITVEQLIPIFKDGNPATSIEVARVKDSEGNSIQYNIVVGKGLYKVGEKAIYIQPDYTVPQTELFKEYHAPGGDSGKCRLGKKGRVRAIKFNFQFEGSNEPIYSNGILISFEKFKSWFENAIFTDAIDNMDLLELPFLNYTEPKNIEIDYHNSGFPYEKILGVEKYVADDNLNANQPSGMVKRLFPSFMYKTDEETIENHKKDVDKCFQNQELLAFTQKRDGSSFTEYFRINPIENVEEFGICSRSQEKKLDQEYVAFYKDGEAILHPYINIITPESRIKGWYNDITEKFYTEEEVKLIPNVEELILEQRDAWVDTDRKYGYLEKLIEYCKKYNAQLVLRGELVGAGNKGSGNKLNSDAKTEAKVIWFGVDDLSSGFSRRIHYGQEHNLVKVCTELGFEYTPELFNGIYSYEGIIERAQEYFLMMKQTYGIIVEGVVIRTKYSNNLSVKFINPEYDRFF